MSKEVRVRFTIKDGTNVPRFLAGIGQAFPEVQEAVPLALVGEVEPTDKRSTGLIAAQDLSQPAWLARKGGLKLFLFVEDFTGLQQFEGPDDWTIQRRIE